MAKPKGDKGMSLRDGKKQLRSLLNRIQSKIKTCAPTDEASASIGYEIGRIYLSMYISVLHSSSSNDTSKSGSKREAKALDEWKNQGYEIIQLLCEGANSGDGNNTINQGVVTGFFSGLTCSEDLLVPFEERDGTNTTDHVYDDFMHWFLRCITTCEEGGHGNILDIAIRSYAKFAYRYICNFYTMGKLQLNLSPSHDDDSGSGTSSNSRNMFITTDASNDFVHLAKLYKKCQLSTTRQCLMRKCINAAFHRNNQDEDQNQQQQKPSLPCIVILLGPLFCVSVVSAQLSDSIANTEATLFISCLMRKCRSLALRQPSNLGHQAYSHHDIWNLIAWLTELIHLMFQSSMPQKNKNHVRAALVIGSDYICDLCEICTFALVRHDGGTGTNDGPIPKKITKQIRVMNTVLNVITGKILPHLASSRSLDMSLSLQPILDHLLDLCNLGCAKQIGRFHIADATMYQLSVMCLITQDQEDVSCILRLISLLVLEGGTPSSSTHTYGRVAWGCICSLGYIFQSVKCCSLVANNLALHASNVLSSSGQLEESKDARTSFRDIDSPGHVFDLFDQDLDLFESFVDGLSIDEMTATSGIMPVKDQAEYLLLGVSMICISMYEFGEIPEHIYSYVSKLTSRYPHLGIRVLPVLIPSFEKPQQDFCRILEFMCESLSSDASCAHEIWSLMYPMTTSSVPVNLRCMAIRLYPILCKSNKRLYSRIHESLGTIVSHPNAKLRVATAATICDLAKFDLIRDVTDVIGWVQSFLTDEESLVTYYSIMALHYLIEADELDYAMVIKVLNKKLVKVDDSTEILELPDIVLEALVQLFGDGEEEGGSGSESSDSDDDDSEIMVSQQVQSSVTALTDLALALSKSVLSPDDNPTYFPVDTTVRLLQMVYQSIGRYSLTSIGIMAEMIRSETTDTEIYETMQIIIQNAIMISISMAPGADVIFDKGLLVVAKKLLLFEQDSLLLWPHQKKTTNTSKCLDMRSALESIPTPIEGTLAHSITEILQKVTDNMRGFSLALECLEDLSLPSSFIPVLSTAFETDFGGSNSAKPACIKALNAQLRIQRRSAAERRDYIKFSITCSQLTPDSLRQRFGSFIPLFISSLDIIIPQWTAGIVEETLPLLWRNICQLGQDTMVEFLRTLQRILGGTLENMNPTVAKAIFETLRDDIFASIYNQERIYFNADAELALFSCMSKVPIDILEEGKIFTFGDANTDAARADLLVYLFSSGYFLEKHQRRYFLQVAIWVAKQKKGNALMSKVCLKLAQSAPSLPSATRKDLINALFENMVVNGVDNLSLELLLFHVSIWAQGLSIKSNLDTEPEKCFTVQLNEGPYEVGKMAHQLGLTEVIGRSVLNLFPKMKQCNYSACFTSIFCSSHEAETSQLQHALISASLATLEAL